MRWIRIQVKSDIAITLYDISDDVPTYGVGKDDVPTYGVGKECILNYEVYGTNYKLVKAYCTNCIVSVSYEQWSHARAVGAALSQHVQHRGEGSANCSHQVDRLHAQNVSK